MLGSLWALKRLALPDETEFRITKQVGDEGIPCSEPQSHPSGDWGVRLPYELAKV